MGGDNVPVYTYTTLDDPLTITATFALGINDMGQIVGGYTSADSSRHGFLLSGGTFTILDDPSATTLIQARNINGLGQIVGYYRNASGDHGFLLSGGKYTTLDDPSAIATFAQGINGTGQVLLQQHQPGRLPLQPQRGTYTTLDDPFAINGTSAYGINDMGQIRRHGDPDRATSDLHSRARLALDGKLDRELLRQAHRNWHREGTKEKSPAKRRPGPHFGYAGDGLPSRCIRRYRLPSRCTSSMPAQSKEMAPLQTGPVSP